MPTQDRRPGKARNPMTDWNRDLKPGEVLLWQGAPDPQGPGLYPAPTRRARLSLIGLLGGVSLLLILALGRQLQRSPTLWLAVAVLVGPMLWAVWYFTGGKPRVDAWWRRRTSYALTDQRALIAVDWPLIGRRCTSHPVARWGNPTWAGTTPGHVHFRWLRVRNQSGRGAVIPVAFEAIHDGAQVLELMQGLKAREVVDGR